MENKYQETIIRFKKYKELTDYISKLEKALDKACKFLEDGYGNGYAVYEYNLAIDNGIEIPESMNSKEWKEWLLRDE